MFFDKYVDFIDVYAEINEEEKESLYQEIVEEEDTAIPCWLSISERIVPIEISIQLCDYCSIHKRGNIPFS